MRAFPSSSRRGFTLIETAIVLGIAALVITSVWIAGSALSTSSNIRNASQDTLAIMHNVRSLYSGRSALGMSGGENADNTSSNDNVLGGGVFPSSMLSTTGRPLNVWGGSVSVLRGRSATMFRVVFAGIPSSVDCARYMVSFLGTNGLNALLLAGAWSPVGPSSTGYGTMTVPLPPTTITTAGCQQVGNSFTGGAEFSLYDRDN